MQLLAASLARARGEEFFPVIAEHLGLALRPREVTISESAAARRARTLAVWRADGGVQNYEYDLAGTPCARVYAGERLLVAVDAASFPNAPQGCVTLLRPAARGQGRRGARSPLRLVRSALSQIERGASAPSATSSRIARPRSCDWFTSSASVRCCAAQRQQLRAEIAAGHDVDRTVVGVERRASCACWTKCGVLPRITAATCWYSGEPGTGKELVARAIHARARARPSPS